ncbi:MAG: class I SAM-dependent DNA methyltransferase [Aestuariivirgaceae bacterium]
MASKPTDDPAEDLVARAYTVKSRDEQQALYHDWAETYDEAMVGGLQYASPRKCAELLARHMSDKQAAILDIGCGTGLAGSELAKHGYHKLDGIDISGDMLDVAAKRGIYRHLFTADLLQPLDIAGGSYDAAICTGTFTHAHVGASCLDEIFRTLKPGAVFAFTVHRDVHEPQGFGVKLKQLEASQIIAPLEHFNDTYYDTSDDPEGHYYAYMKA